MKKKNGSILLAIIACCTQLAIAQPRNNSSKVEELKSFLKARAGIFGDVGFEWEKKIGIHSSLSVFGGILIGRKTDDFWNNSAPLAILPSASTEYRCYYNLQKRSRLDKKTENNSANFFFGKIETSFKVPDQNFFGLFFMQGWGMQRRLWKRLSFDSHLGIIEHLYYDKPPIGGYRYTRIEAIIDCSLVYLF